MTPGIIALIVIVIVALAVVGLVSARPQVRRRRLRMRFGPEYDHALRAHSSREEAERALLAREERHRRLDLRPLDPEARGRYRGEWTAIQQRFVDDPRAATGEAERLITSIMSDQGYPDEGHEQRLADLSVGHTRAVGHYRQAREVGVRAAADGASTEELRQALMHYRALFDDLLAGRDGPDRRATAETAETAETRADGRRTDETRTESRGG